MRKDIRAGQEFRGGSRGKYAARFIEGTNLVLLAPDVAAKLATAVAVNRALREIIGAWTTHRTTWGGGSAASAGKGAGRLVRLAVRNYDEMP